MPHPRKLLGVLAAAMALGVALFAHPAWSEDAARVPDHPMLRDGWFVSAGALWAESNVTANLNTGRLGVGALIDFEDDVGLDENNLIGLYSVRWRFASRWQLEVEYFNSEREDTRQVERVIEWGNLSIPVNGTVTSNFDVEDFRVGVGWSFFRSQDKEVGIGLGAHVASLDAGLATANRGSQRASETAPLPFATVYARIALTDRWLLSMRVDRLSLDTGDIDGKVFSSAADFIYQPWRHFSIGLGYRDINFQISSVSDDWRGKAQVQQSGPALYVAATF